jgi:hypothetical protein
MMMTSKHRKDLVAFQNPREEGSRDDLFDHDIAIWPPMGQLTAHGAPEAAEWRAAVATLLHDSNLPHGAPILCDVRDVTRLGRSIGGDLLRLVAPRRLAFVARAGTAPRLARQISSANPQHAQIFTEYETALRWLLYAEHTQQRRKKTR